MVARSRILSGLLEDGATRFDPLGPPGELHVLDVDQRGVNVLDGQQLVVDAVDLVVLHATLVGETKKERMHLTDQFKPWLQLFCVSVDGE